MLAIRLEFTVEDFFANGGIISFADRMAGVLGIHASDIKVVSVYTGSTIVDFQVVQREPEKKKEKPTVNVEYEYEGEGEEEDFEGEPLSGPRPEPQPEPEAEEEVDNKLDLEKINQLFKGFVEEDEPFMGSSILDATSNGSPVKSPKAEARLKHHLDLVKYQDYKSEDDEFLQFVEDQMGNDWR